MSLTLTLERGGGEVSGSGTNIELDGTIAGGAIEAVEMYGDTEQTTYSGKNLNAYPYTGGGSGRGITFTPDSDGTVVLNGQNNGQGNSVYFFFSNQNNPMTLPAGTYYIVPPSNTRVGFVMYDGTSYYGFSASNGYSFTFSDSVSIRQFYVQVYHTDVTFSNLKIYPMLTTSAQHTEADYEPYVGGTASPNPDYPQEVKTVTGEQTITISDGNGQSQSYSVNLGDIELCKIGDYQDYIYKSGEDWYVRKETTKVVLDGTETWAAGGPANVFYSYSFSDYATTNNLGYSTIATGVVNVSGSGAFDGIAPDNSFAFNDGTVSSRLYWKSTKFANAATFKTWLTSNPTPMYYALATPTDTQITDATLIAQLEALNAGETYDGTTVITVSSENLAGSLEVKASSTITKTYTEVEIGSPFTITDVEGKSSNTTLDGNVYVDWAYNKKQYSFDLFNLTPQDYADIRAFYDYQFNNSAFPTITVPELNIDKLPVYMEISSRNIINQCLLTDKLTIKFRETVQP